MQTTLCVTFSSTRFILWLSILGWVCTIETSCHSGKKIQDQVPADLQSQRDRITHQLSVQLDSIIERTFFPFAPEWIKKATYLPLEEMKPIELATFDGQVKRMQEAGIIEIIHQDSSYTLKAFRELGAYNPMARTQILIPFTDRSSASSTYAGGRYLQISMPSEPTITLDFNRSFFPFCAYSERFVCPIPPLENALPFTIEAGEKNP